jgi:hypothetical protein
MIMDEMPNSKVPSGLIDYSYLDEAIDELFEFLLNSESKTLDELNEHVDRIAWIAIGMRYGKQGLDFFTENAKNVR